MLLQLATGLTDSPYDRRQHQRQSMCDRNVNKQRTREEDLVCGALRCKFSVGRAQR